MHKFLSSFKFDTHKFITFADTYLQKAKKIFSDGRSRRNMNALNTQLQDVQRIMVQNIDDVLQRGTVLSGKNCENSFLSSENANKSNDFNFDIRIRYKNAKSINAVSEVQKRCSLFEQQINVHQSSSWISCIFRICFVLFHSLVTQKLAKIFVTL